MMPPGWQRVKARIGFLEQVWNDVRRIEVTPNDDAVGHYAAGVRHVIAQLVAAAFEYPFDITERTQSAVSITMNSRGSVILPVTADAATVAGLPR